MLSYANGFAIIVPNTKQDAQLLIGDPRPPFLEAGCARVVNSDKGGASQFTSTGRFTLINWHPRNAY